MATTAAPELVSIDPVTLEPVGSVPRTEPGAVCELVAAAAVAQRGWADETPEERARVVGLAGRVVRARARGELVHVARRSLGR